MRASALHAPRSATEPQGFGDEETAVGPSSSQRHSLGLRLTRRARWMHAAIVPLGIVLLGFIAGPVQGDELETAQSAYLTGDYAAALAAAERSTLGHYADVRWWRLRLDCLSTLGRYPEAAEVLQTSLRQHYVDGAIRLTGHHVLQQTGNPKQGRELLDELLRIAAGSPWRFHAPADRVGLGRVAAAVGVDARQVLEQFFDQAKKIDPDLRDVYVATGELALMKHDATVAAETFREALKKFPDDPDLLCGLARALEDDAGDEGTKALAAALARNPRHLPSLFVVAEEALAHEEFVEAQTALAKILAVNPQHARAWSLAAVLAHLRCDPFGERFCREMALRNWPQNPEVDHVIGAKLSRGYRFAEGAAYQRRALKWDPEYLAAKAQLAQDLLRLGEAEEGWRLASEVQHADEYDVVAYNLSTLHERVKQYATLETPHFRVHMDRREAAVYGDRVLALLERARTVLGKKYGWLPQRPVTVEILTSQSDFAIRTFGLPGGDGILGVCFGQVITANSPAALAGRDTNWQATLWHEYCHVVTLELTHHRIPRWLSEGISVYEERQADPAWGNRLDQEARQMILAGEMPRVGELNQAFRKPRSAAHFDLAYLQASLVVEYLVDTLGRQTLDRVLADVAGGVPINDSLELRTGNLHGFEKAFDTYARKLAADEKNALPEADTIAAHRKHIEAALTQRDAAAIATGIERYLAINPLEEYPYRIAAEHLGQAPHLPQAVAAARSLVALDPADRAGAHFLLAKLLHAANDAEAKRHVLLALEETPRYREAQRLLLAIVEPPSNARSETAGPKPPRKPTMVEP